MGYLLMETRQKLLSDDVAHREFSRIVGYDVFGKKLLAFFGEFEKRI